MQKKPDLSPTLPLERIAKGKDLIKGLMCPLCDGILWNAVLCANCHNIFCQNCIKDFTKTNGGLCQCGGLFIEKPLLPWLHNLLSTLEFYCPNSGCEEMISYEKILEHEERCPMAMLACGDCGEKVKRNDMEEHKKNACKGKMETCEDCNEVYLAKEREEHLSTCKIIQCKKCQTYMTKSKFASHTCSNDAAETKPKTESDQSKPLSSGYSGVMMEKLTNRFNLIVCPKCEHMTQLANIYKCTFCSARMCYTKCLDYCRTCKQAICTACTYSCLNCRTSLCQSCKSKDHCHALHFLHFHQQIPYLHSCNVKAFAIKKIKLNSLMAEPNTADLVFVEQAVYIAGGKSGDTVYLGDTIKIPMTNPSLQRNLPPLITARSMHRLVATDSKQFFCVGGKNARESLSACEVFNVRKEVWRSIAAMNEPRCCPSIVAIDKLIYVFGGMNEHKKVVEEYKPVVNAWVTIEVSMADGWMHNGQGIGVQTSNEVLIFENNETVYKWDGKEMKKSARMKSPGIFTQSKPIIAEKIIYLFDNNYKVPQIVLYSLVDASIRPIPAWEEFITK
eukprot:TRINITY_DN18833_c0_g2_i2.p1 TRINITY_DN18833_c0_g2~~TRINITY_DN18833_c0_g2_i2.p1  ORF type:complete len:560 (+),score=122.70 TRINITY_DN18833_c0_g2_i2:97-1776(+)